jgi:Protein of unknown function (DUF3089)
MLRLLTYSLCLLTALAACRKGPVVLRTRQADGPTPPAPAYAQAEAWAALPTRADAADRTPADTLPDGQATAPADVFFIHPTTFTESPQNAYHWNANIADAKLNQKTDEGSILNQASLFNAAGRVYAPRYRQAHIYAYFTPQKQDAAAAFDTAYADVKRAFQYYLAHYNQGRPIMVAAHSQGAQHGRRLLKEFFDGQPRLRQLVAAYLVGMPIPANAFAQIPPCASPTQTGCFCTWNTYSRDYYPPNYESYLCQAVNVNPLLWTTDSTLAPAGLNLGAVGRKFKLYPPGTVDAQVQGGMLWIGRLNVRGAGLVRLKNWHIADYNLFYLNVRHNARQRVAAFLRATEP